MEDIRKEGPAMPLAPRPEPPILAPVLMMVFWMLLGGASGIKIMQGLWRLLGFGAGEVGVAVPVGGAVGAVCGALLGWVRHPRLLVLLMAIFAGSSAGSVAGQLPWGDVGEIGGQAAGGLLGGLAWAAWLYLWERKGAAGAQPSGTGLEALTASGPGRTGPGGRSN